MKIKFRAVRANDWLLVKEAYINMFNDKPEAFGEPVQEILQRGNEDWKRFTNAQTRMIKACAYLALHGADICGFVRCTTADVLIPAGTALISNLWVHPDHRRKGAGTTLINLVIIWARWKGISLITLGVTAANRDVARYYEGLGFHDLGRRIPNPNQPEEAIMVMGRKLGHTGL